MTDYVIDRRGLCFISGCSMTLPCKRYTMYAIHKITKHSYIGNRLRRFQGYARILYVIRDLRKGCGFIFPVCFLYRLSRFPIHECLVILCIAYLSLCIVLRNEILYILIWRPSMLWVQTRGKNNIYLWPMTS
jgi:hypothetical protein